MFDKIFNDFGFYSQAKDESLWHEVLVERILDYKILYLKIMQKNIEKINDYLTEINSNINFNIDDNTKGVLRLLIFLKSGTELLNQKNNINHEKFKHYTKINSDQKRKEWLETLSYVENDLDWVEIKKLNSSLQFIITFYYDLELRIQYFEKYFEVRQTDKTTGLLEESYNKLKRTIKPNYRVSSQ